MREYRIYPLNPAGAIAGAEDVRCDDDGRAFEVARQKLQPGQKAEVWSGSHYMGRVVKAEALQA